MKIHSSKPDHLDKLVLTYSVKSTIVNMPIKNKNQIKLFKEPAFRVLGLWKIKSLINGNS